MADSGADYEYGKRCLTADVNHVVEAAFAAGATRIVVCDGHGPGGLNWDQVNPRVTIERGGPLPNTFPSLHEGEFDCAFLIGQHAMAGSTEAFLEHTQNGQTWFELKIAGEPAGEMSQFAAVMGYFGLPLALVSGDSGACREAARLFPSAVTAEVKATASKHQATCHPRQYVERLLADKTAEAMANVRAGKVKSWIVPGPVTVELTLQRLDLSDEWARSHPSARRITSRTLQWEVPDARYLCDL